MVQRWIPSAHFPALKSLDTFDSLAIPSMNKALVMQLTRCEYVERRANAIADLPIHGYVPSGSVIGVILVDDV